MRSRLLWPFLLAGLGAAPLPLAAQAALRGVVVEEGTSRPLAGVRVMLERTYQQTITDESGRFFLADLPLGTRIVLFSSIGHIPLRLQVSLTQGDTTFADVSMLSDPLRLDSVVVNAPSPGRVNPRLVEFEERRSRGIGFHLDSAYLRRAENRRFSEVLREAPSIRIMPFQESRGGGIVPITKYFAASVRRTGMGGQPCYLSVFLDGQPIYRSGGIGGGGFGDPPDWARDFQVTNFDAVEVYASPAEVPIEFSGRHAECGVILLWTRRGR